MGWKGPVPNPHPRRRAQRVYHEELLSWYAQREVQKTSGSEHVEVSFQMSRLPVERLVMTIRSAFR